MQDESNNFIRKTEVRKMTGLSDTTIWRQERAGNFPRRRYLSKNIRGWVRAEILAWIESRPIVDGENHEQEAK